MTSVWPIPESAYPAWDQAVAAWRKSKSSMRETGEPVEPVGRGSAKRGRRQNRSLAAGGNTGGLTRSVRPSRASRK